MGIPEFQSFGTVVGQNVAGALAGKMTVDQALKASQAAANKAVKQADLRKWFVRSCPSNISEHRRTTARRADHRA